MFALNSETRHTDESQAAVIIKVLFFCINLPIYSPFGILHQSEQSHFKKSMLSNVFVLTVEHSRFL